MTRTSVEMGALRGGHSVHAMSNADDWETPPEVFGPLHAEFGFTLDAASLPHNAKCDRFFTPDDDGLAQDWGSHVVWLNPPYGKTIRQWVRRAYQASKAGATVVCLVPARTDTAWWHDYAMKGEIRFLRGRVRFERHGQKIGTSTKGSNKSPFPSAVVVFRPAIGARMGETKGVGKPGEEHVADGRAA